MENANNVISWFSLSSSDFNRAVIFYESILEIEMPRSQMPDGTNMALFQDPDYHGVNGDINDAEEVSPSKDGAIIFFRVDGRLDEILARVEGVGGSIDMPRTAIGDWGFIARIIDTEGNRVGLHSSV